MQGCLLNCKYCHNPDTWAKDAGKAITVEDAVKEVLKYKNYIKTGGVTFSGGEPLLQIDFVMEVAKRLKANGIHVAVDTSGATFDFSDNGIVKTYRELIKYVDLFLLDIKHIDSDKHKFITGKGNENTLKFAQFLDDNGVDIWVRYVLCPTLSDDMDGVKKLKDFINTLKSVKKVEVLPYHTLGVYKYKQLGIAYPLEGVSPPDKQLLETVKNVLGAN
jgi:pyruvate formate lyase activating enzyme